MVVFTVAVVAEGLVTELALVDPRTFFARASSADRTKHVVVHVVAIQTFSFPTDIAVLLRRTFVAADTIAFLALAVQSTAISTVETEEFPAMFTGENRTTVTAHRLLAKRTIVKDQLQSLITSLADGCFAMQARIDLVAIGAKFGQALSAFV